MKTFSIVFTVLLGVISSALASSAPPCPSDGSIVQFYPDSDCTKFWQCSNGVAYQKKCPNDGTNWNPVKNTCDWAASAGCTGEGWSTTVAPPATTTTPIPSESTTTPRSTTTPGTTTANPGTTTSKFPSSTSRSTTRNPTTTRSTTTTTTQRPTTTTVTTTRRPTTRTTTTRRPTTRTTTRRRPTTTRTTTTTTQKPTKGPKPNKDCEKWGGKGGPWWCRPPYYPPKN